MRTDEDIRKLLQQFDHPESPIVLQCTLRNVDDDARMFSWAGIGFGQQETFHLSMSLRKLAMETPGLLRLRFWGKILGTGGDYYIAEGAMEVPKVERPPPPALPGTPDYDVEPLGEGSNIFVYWVTGTSCSSWVRLPSARASHILAAQNIKKLMTGSVVLCGASRRVLCLRSDVSSVPAQPTHAHATDRRELSVPAIVFFQTSSRVGTVAREPLSHNASPHGAGALLATSSKSWIALKGK